MVSFLGFEFYNTPLFLVKGEYNYIYVILSVLIACVGGIIALNYARLIRWCEADKRNLYHFIAALVLGTSIWGMHFIGMLAYEMDMVHTYDPLITAVSFLIAVAFSWMVFMMNRTMKNLNYWNITAMAIILGVGISAMHYTGMSAMEMDAAIYYNLNLFLLSIFIAITASGAGVLICYLYANQESPPHFGYKLMGGAIIGAAICSMHFTGMAATHFAPYAHCQFNPDQSFERLVFIVTLVVVFVSLIAELYYIEAKRDGSWLYRRTPFMKKMVQYKAVTITAVLGLCLSFYTFDQTKKNRYKELEMVKADLIDNFILHTQTELQRSIYLLEAIQAFFYSSEHVSQSEFMTFSHYVGLDKKDLIKEIFIARPLMLSDGSLTYEKFLTSSNIKYKNASINTTFNTPQIEALFEMAAIEKKAQVAYINQSDNTDKFKKDFLSVVPIFNHSLTTPSSEEQINIKKFIADNILGFSVVVKDAQKFFSAIGEKVLLPDTSLRVTEKTGHLIFQSEPEFKVQALSATMPNIYGPDLLITAKISNASLNSKLFMAYLYFGICILLTFLTIFYIYTLIKSRIQLSLSELSHKYYLKEAKQARKQAEDASKTKDMFLANMSHEIRTPMNSIIGMAWLLAKSNLNKEQKTWAETITNSGNTLLQIINDILDISKIEAGKMKITPQKINLSRQIDDVCALFTPLCQEKDITLTTSIPPTAPDYINADPVRLQQILINLVGNAVKFTHKGNITISCSAVKSTKGRTAIHFEVADEGVGIKPEKLKYIFKKFSQASEKSTRNFGGTGLGLPITKKLINLMGGEIYVASKVNEGSTFKFHILTDLAENKADADTKEIQGDAKPDNKKPHTKEHDLQRLNEDIERKKMNLAGRRILVVEDIQVNHMLMKKLLEPYKAVVDIAENGQEAVNMFKEHPYDIILMDCQMPVMDGFEATNRIRSLKGGKETKIVALTADAMVGDREKCLKSGMDDYLNKPLRPHQLHQTLKKWLTS